MVSAEPSNNSPSLPFLILDAQPLVEPTRNMETKLTLGLRALDRTSATGSADIATLPPPSLRDSRTIDAVPALGVVEEHFGDEERTRYVRPLAVNGGLHRTTFCGAQATVGGALHSILRLRLRLIAA